VNRPGSDTGPDTPPPLVGWVPRPASTLRSAQAPRQPSHRWSRGGRKCRPGKTSSFVELVLLDPVGYRSNSQRARVATEAWVTKNLYCPACPSPDLEPTPTGHPVADFACPRCGEEYQLKSKRGHLGARMTDAAYSEALRATERNAFPHLLLMQYVEIPTSHPESRPGDVQRSGNPAAD